MITQTIRFLDAKIGRIICFGLTLHRYLGDLLRKNNNSHRHSKIVFIKLIEQGSTVLAYPALKRAVELVGKENLYFLVFRENRPILDLLDVVPAANIIEINPGNFFTFLLSTLRALAAIRRQNIDTCVDLEFFSRGSAILSYLSGASNRVGLHQSGAEGPYRGDLFTHRFVYNPYLHTQTLFLNLVEALRYKMARDCAPLKFIPHEHSNGLPRYSCSEEQKRGIVDKVETLKRSALGKPVIILNPNIGDLLPIRRWPAENFVRLGMMLLGEYPQASIVLTGTLSEKKGVDDIASQIPGAVSLAGKTTLRELLTLYTVSDVLVTNDSGPALFSALTPIKSIVLFGPETPLLYAQNGANRENICLNLACSPCVNAYNYRQSHCQDALCLKGISAESVLEKLKKFLAA